MTTINPNIIKAAIDDLGSEFDTHEVIVKIMRMNPAEYISALHSFYLNCQGPFQQLDADIGKILSASNWVESTGRHNSLNIFGDNTGNETWRKR